MTIDQFSDLINNLFEKKLMSFKNSVEENLKNKTNLVTIKTLTETLMVTKPTIYNWIKKGVIKSQKMGGKVLFDLPVILKAIETKESAFGNGRDYLYKNPLTRNIDEKERRRYNNICGKVRGKISLTEEEKQFFEKGNIKFKF